MCIWKTLKEITFAVSNVEEKMPVGCWVGLDQVSGPLWKELLVRGEDMRFKLLSCCNFPQSSRVKRGEGEKCDILNLI